MTFICATYRRLLASLNDVLGVEFNDVLAPLNGVQYTIYNDVSRFASF